MTSHLEAGLLQELLDGEIPSSELSPIQAHLAICAECRARLDEARAIGAEADRLIETIEPADAPARPVPRIPAARPKAWTRNVAWAATVVIAAGVGYVARSSPAASPTQPMAAKETVAAEPESSISAPAAPPAEARRSEVIPRVANQAARERASDAAASPPAATPAEGAKVEAKAAVSGELGRLAARSESDSLDKKGTRALGDSRFRLEEIVVSSAGEGKARVAPSAAAPPPGLLTQTEKRAAPPDTLKVNADRLDEVASNAAAAGLRAKAASPAVQVTLSEAMKRLNGSLRLIEGLVPVRLEVLGPDVRVVYPLTKGELLLSQRLENGKIVFRLEAPLGFPVDSLERLRARVRE